MKNKNNNELIENQVLLFSWTCRELNGAMEMKRDMLA